jgi:hypothetical protein
MTQTAVTDVLANSDEYVVALAKLLGKGRKLDLFRAVYAGRADRKQVSDLATQLGAPLKTVLNAGKTLVDAHTIGQVRTAQGIAYTKLPAIKPIRDRVLKIAGNPKAIAAIPTKRSPEIKGDLFRPARTPSLRAPMPRKGANWKIAMLIASPIGQTPIDVSLEAREVEIERRKARNGGAFELKVYPAAGSESLVTALNDDDPDVVHFSGHGGEGAIILDNETIRDVGGQTVEARTLARILKTASRRPRLLVLNACESAADAEALTEAVDTVIAMTAVVPDSTAYSYSRRLYAALFAGLSIARAHEQACAVLSIDDPDGASLPVLVAASGVDPGKVHFT